MSSLASPAMISKLQMNPIPRNSLRYIRNLEFKLKLINFKIKVKKIKFLSSKVRNLLRKTQVKNTLQLHIGCPTIRRPTIRRHYNSQSTIRRTTISRQTIRRIHINDNPPTRQSANTTIRRQSNLVITK
jgi:hypothetical protein